MSETLLTLLIATIFFAIVYKIKVCIKTEIFLRNIRKYYEYQMSNNILTFEVYCFLVQKLLVQAKKDGIGSCDEININYCVKYRKVISQRYCDGEDYVSFIMAKAQQNMHKHGYCKSFFSLDNTIFYSEETVWYVEKSRLGKRYTTEGQNLRVPQFPLDGVHNKNWWIKQLIKFNKIADWDTDAAHPPYNSKLQNLQKVDKWLPNTDTHSELYLYGETISPKIFKYLKMYKDRS